MLSVRHRFWEGKEMVLKDVLLFLVLLVFLMDFFIIRNNFLHFYACSFAFELEIWGEGG